ncbi:hypothetical protein BN381_290060 [Candidatus Microthrix parvicella RN1]|uniref:Uncharacterized protein n=1 Tax=Candidatus Neomicrothrix parvicella RN1 TaxID=1229780 RepID=R4Z335_9ACTN|nr:hypothetical protein BN381_290060 [Candidatus Microthrix parvicella RN1]
MPTTATRRFTMRHPPRFDVARTVPHTSSTAAAGFAQVNVLTVALAEGWEGSRVSAALTSSAANDQVEGDPHVTTVNVQRSDRPYRGRIGAVLRRGTAS